MGQTPNTIPEVLLKGLDLIQLEIEELEKERAKLYRDVNMPKELARLVSLVDDKRTEFGKLLDEKVKLTQEIQFIASEQATAIKTRIGKEIEAITEGHKSALEKVNCTNNKVKLLNKEKENLEGDIKSLKEYKEEVNAGITKDKAKMDEFEIVFKKKVLTKTNKLDAIETSLEKREDKVEESIALLVGREEKVKNEESANDELIKGLLADMEGRELGIRNKIIQLDKTDQKNKDSIGEQRAILNKKDAALKKLSKELEDRENAGLAQVASLKERDEVLTARENDLDINWQVFIKEQGKFKDIQRKLDK